MPRNEAQTRRDLIDPALSARGWTQDHVKVEVSTGGYDIVTRKRRQGRTDYLLRIIVSRDTQPVSVALIEAKAEDKSPGFGLQQGKRDGDIDRLNVKYIFSTNGHQFVEYDKFTGLTSSPRPMSEFPSEEELRKGYEKGMGFSLESETAKPLLVRYSGGEGERRYYQDAAIRATLEKIAQGKNRVLLSLATGAGKTFIAVNLLKRIVDAGLLRKALFLCDRDELRTQALNAFQGKFGSNAAAVENNNPQKNAKIIIATYQSLGLEENDDAGFFTRHYPENYFSHIVIDECHRSAWHKWSLPLTRNENAVQIGLTATPRILSVKEDTEEFLEDNKITAHNIRYFGEPVYEYGMLQAIEDGFLAACEIQKGNVNLDDTGISFEEALKHNPRDWITGKPVAEDDLKDMYERTDYESKIMLPDRVFAMCMDLFDHLLKAGEPEQKTIVFCVRDIHAELVSGVMNNLYAEWCRTRNKNPAAHYAFKCTAKSGGSENIADMKGSNTDWFVAATVDLLSTGVDIPAVRNIVFFRYMKSPISFYQMVGRGTRLAENKDMFTIYDYTDATRLFGEDFISRPGSPKDAQGSRDGGGEPPRIITVDGFNAEVTDTGRYIVTQVDGEIKRVSIDEYKQGLARKLLGSATTITEFRQKWIEREKRREMIDDLVQSGYSPALIQEVENLTEYDLYDVLIAIAYGQKARKRDDRVFNFRTKEQSWLESLPVETKDVLLAIVQQFSTDGTEVFDRKELFSVYDVMLAGGIDALKKGGDAASLLRQAKERMFAA
jgi:type I restriction enzyme R subunit